MANDWHGLHHRHKCFTISLKLMIGALTGPCIPYLPVALAGTMGRLANFPGGANVRLCRLPRCS